MRAQRHRVLACNNLDSLTDRCLFNIAHISERERPLGVLVVSKELAKDIGGDSRERRVSQAAIAAISGLMPTMFMTRVRL
jgi:hypothetical protein